MQPQDHEQFAHALLPETTVDEFSRQEFVKSYKLHLASQVSPNTKVVYDTQIKPALEKEHGRPPKNRHEIRKAMNGDANTGFWNVLVHSDGDYEVRLRRWPETADLKINAALDPGAGVPGARAYRTQPGKSIDPARASLQIGDVSADADVNPNATEVVFRVKLKKGKTRMTGLFTTASGEKYGAYYAYVKKL